MKKLLQTIIVIGLVLLSGRAVWAAISDATKTDLNFKFNQLKQFSTTAKQFYEEATNRFVQTDHDQVWLASLGTATTTEQSAGKVTCTNDLTMTEDTSVSLNKSWTTGIRRWVPPFYGTNWTVRIYQDNGSGAKGTEILTTDSIDWFFDYAEGRFTAQSSVAGKTRPLHIQGCYYTGSLLSAPVFNNSTTTNATTTSLAVLNLTAASCDVKSTTSGSLYCGTDATGGGGGGSGTVSTSTPLVDTYVTYATGVDTIGAEAAFTYDDATDLLTVSKINVTQATSTNLFSSILTGNTLRVGQTATTAIASDGKLGIGVTPTVELSIVGPTNPEIRIGETTLSSYLSIQQHAPTRSQISSANNTTGVALIDFDPLPSDGTSNASFRFFRSTNTTGATAFSVHKGDGSATTQHNIVGNGSSYLQNDSGTLTIGPSVSAALGTAQLSVKGNLAIGSTFYNKTTPTSGVLIEGVTGIGTSTPNWALQVASSTGAQLTLTDSSLATYNHWSLYNNKGLLWFATSSPLTFATSTTAALHFDTNGQANFGNSASVPQNQKVCFNGSTCTTYFVYDGTNLKLYVANVLTQQW